MNSGFARERDPKFIESIRRAREQVKRGETFTRSELDRLFSDYVDGVDLADFSAPLSIETLTRTKCAQVPPDRGTYVVLRPRNTSPKFLKQSVGGRFKAKDPTAPPHVLTSRWVKDATIVYVGKGDGARGLRQRLWQLIQFGMGKNIGHWGGRLIWQLADHRQLMVRWKATGKENPEQVKQQLLNRFESERDSLPFANIQD